MGTNQDTNGMIFATLCYLKRDGKTLMIHRIRKTDDIHKGKWNGLGGKLIPGETPEECIVREVFEESGLSIEQPVLHGFLTFPNFSNNKTWYTFVYVSRKFSGDLIDSDEGELRWIDDTQLLDLDLWEGDYIFLPWLDENRFFSGLFQYEDGSLKHHHVVFHPWTIEDD